MIFQVLETRSNRIKVSNLLVMVMHKIANVDVNTNKTNVNSKKNIFVEISPEIFKSCVI